MKRLALLIAIALPIACRPKPSGPPTGAVAPRAAVEQFMNAVRAQDLQAMSAIWGNQKGPARDQYPLEEVEKRELLMKCYLEHEAFRITAETRTSRTQWSYGVELRKGSLIRATTVYAVEGPRERWYVENVDLEPVKDFCRPPPTNR